MVALAGVLVSECLSLPECLPLTPGSNKEIRTSQQVASIPLTQNGVVLPVCKPWTRLFCSGHSVLLNCERVVGKAWQRVDVTRGCSAQDLTDLSPSLRLSPTNIPTTGR